MDLLDGAFPPSQLTALPGTYSALFNYRVFLFFFEESPYFGDAVELRIYSLHLKCLTPLTSYSKFDRSSY